ncbi:hypothetical protein [Klebsiella oxytoca]|uniref:hypothetical protein n=1 Tax=Klebsiella oxytoca TaxID=571 RepID=UPI00124B908A|nr:hypothetical protein [Klebsiella oxytoca]
MNREIITRHKDHRVIICQLSQPHDNHYYLRHSLAVKALMKCFSQAFAGGNLTANGKAGDPYSKPV